MSQAGLRIDRSELSGGELDECAVVALRAFYSDPFFEYLSPGARLRNRGLFIFFRTALGHLGPGGRVTTVRDDNGRIVGVSAWIAPGGYPQPVATQLAGMPGVLRALYRRPRALVAGTKYLDAIAKAHPKEDLWYLYLLVADPELQRRGVGSMLLEDRLGEVDEASLPAYLETQKQDNLAYYRRHGFELVKPLTPVEGGPPIYTMRREARAKPI
jgi:ribosomal protein S18 acetylase RimI-like enzyme